MKSERGLVDPQDCYPADGLRAAEEHAAKVIQLLPGAQVERTRDVIQIDAGGDTGIVVLVTTEALELRLPTVEWTMGSHGPATSSRLWKRLKWDQLQDGQLPGLLAQAQAARRREYRNCPYCGGRFPPEHRVEKNICHTCAEKHLGIVY